MNSKKIMEFIDKLIESKKTNDGYISNFVNDRDNLFNGKYKLMTEMPENERYSGYFYIYLFDHNKDMFLYVGYNKYGKLDKTYNTNIKTNKEQFLSDKGNYPYLQIICALDSAADDEIRKMVSLERVVLKNYKTKKNKYFYNNQDGGGEGMILAFESIEIIKNKMTEDSLKEELWSIDTVLDLKAVQEGRSANVANNVRAMVQKLIDSDGKWLKDRKGVLLWPIEKLEDGTFSYIRIGQMNTLTAVENENCKPLVKEVKVRLIDWNDAKAAMDEAGKFAITDISTFDNKQDENLATPADKAHYIQLVEQFVEAKNITDIKDYKCSAIEDMLIGHGLDTKETADIITKAQDKVTNENIPSGKMYRDWSDKELEKERVSHTGPNTIAVVCGTGKFEESKVVGAMFLPENDGKTRVSIIVHHGKKLTNKQRWHKKKMKEKSDYLDVVAKSDRLKKKFVIEFIELDLYQDRPIIPTVISNKSEKAA